VILICCYCPDFDRTSPANAAATHGICPSCVAKMDAELSAREVTQLERTIEDAQRTARLAVA
jgi:hypothetical protein